MYVRVQQRLAERTSEGEGTEIVNLRAYSERTQRKGHQTWAENELSAGSALAGLLAEQL